MSHAVFAHRKIKHLYHPAFFFDSRKVYRPAFFDRTKSIAIPLWQSIDQRGLFMSLARLIRVTKAVACCGVHLLVKSRRFCCFCLFKPGFCKFLAKNPFKKQFLLFITVFTIKRHIVPRCGAFMKEKKAFFFPMYNSEYARFRFHLMKAKQL